MLLNYLSKENLPLAKAEVLELTKNSKLISDGRIVLLKINYSKKLERLAYNKAIFKVLFTTRNSKFLEEFKKYNWAKIYKKNFAIRIHKEVENDLKEKELAGYVWDKIKNPKVNLTRPNTAIEVIITKTKTYTCLKLYDNKEDFLKRRPHLRPGFKPISMNPKLSRAVVNLTGIETGELLDPMCGTGSFLIEASLMGIKSIGYDYSFEELKNAKKNIEFLKLKNIKLEKKDATKFTKKYDFIATDLPYGKGTSLKDHEKLYVPFLKNLKKNLKKQAVIVFPSFINYKPMIKKAKLKIKKIISYRVHKSLTRKIVIINP